MLETRSQPSKGFVTHDQRDHQVLESLLTDDQVGPSFGITQAGKEEPLLWLADALAGARTDFLCGVDREMWGLVAHRVSALCGYRCPRRAGPRDGANTANPGRTSDEGTKLLASRLEYLPIDLPSQEDAAVHVLSPTRRVSNTNPSFLWMVCAGTTAETAGEN